MPASVLPMILALMVRVPVPELLIPYRLVGNVMAPVNELFVVMAPMILFWITAAPDDFTYIPAKPSEALTVDWENITEPLPVLAPITFPVVVPIFAPIDPST